MTRTEANDQRAPPLAKWGRYVGADAPLSPLSAHLGCARSFSPPFLPQRTLRLVSAGACAPRRSQSVTRHARTRRAPPRTGRVFETDRRGLPAAGGTS